MVCGCKKFNPALAYLLCQALPRSCLATFAYFLADLCTDRSENEAFWGFLMMKEESRWGEWGDRAAFGRAINLSSSSPHFLSFLPAFLVVSDERKSFRDTGSETEERERERESPLIFGVPAFFPGCLSVVQGREYGMLGILVENNRNASVHVFITEIIWQTFDVIIDNL